MEVDIIVALKFGRYLLFLYIFINVISCLVCLAYFAILFIKLYTQYDVLHMIYVPLQGELHVAIWDWVYIDLCDPVRPNENFYRFQIGRLY